MYAVFRDIAAQAFERYTHLSNSSSSSSSSSSSDSITEEDWLALGHTALSLLAFQLQREAIEPVRFQAAYPASVALYLQELIAFYEQLQENLKTHTCALDPTRISVSVSSTLTTIMDPINWTES